MNSDGLIGKIATENGSTDTEQSTTAQSEASRNDENEKLSSALLIANKELVYQNEEKGKRADELVLANTELAYQNSEKEKRAAELIIANKELVFQNEEKEKRANELVIANDELRYQNSEKEKRAAELVVANRELVFQNQEKEKRANELELANIELAYQNAEKEKRKIELLNANRDLQSFTFISSHDLQEPLRKIQIFTSRIMSDDYGKLSEKGQYYFDRIVESSKDMQTRIKDLNDYSMSTAAERTFEFIDLRAVIEGVLALCDDEIQQKKAIIEIGELSAAYGVRFELTLLLKNLVDNALKFSRPEQAPHIRIKSTFYKGNKTDSKNLISEAEYCHITISDNGIGFDPQYNERIFGIFQHLNKKTEYKGTGMGLAIARKIVENHNGIINADGELNNGAVFNVYLPLKK